MEPWPLASFQYVTAVYLILSAQTDWLNSVLAVCLLKRALWTKHYGHFILLLWIFYQWPLVETVRWDFTTEKSVESILYHQCLLASLDSFFIPFSTSDLILSHLKRTKWLSSFSLFSSFFFFFSLNLIHSFLPYTAPVVNHWPVDFCWPLVNWWEGLVYSPLFDHSLGLTSSE